MRCPNVPPEIPDEFAFCSYSDCPIGRCVFLRRDGVADLPNPTVHDDREIDLDDGPMPTWDSAFDWGRSPA